MVQEAIFISEQASLNSKAEFRSYKLARLTIEQSDYETKKEQELAQIKAQNLDREMTNFKVKIKGAPAQPSVCNMTNPPLDFSRKRKNRVDMEQASDVNAITVGGDRVEMKCGRFSKRPRSENPSITKTPTSKIAQPSTSTPQNAPDNKTPVIAPEPLVSPVLPAPEPIETVGVSDSEAVINVS